MIGTLTRGSKMKKTAFLVLLTLIASTDAQAVSRRGVQRANILQLIYPNPAPAPQPAPVVTPVAPAHVANSAPAAPVDPTPAP